MMGVTILTDSPRFVNTPFLPNCDSQISLYIFCESDFFIFDRKFVFSKIQRNFYSRPAPAVQMIPMQVPMDNYQFQPALQYLPQYQPTIQPQRWSDNSSLKTFSDIESYMTSRKLKDMPQWKPNQYQQMPIYCESRSEYEFLVKAIMHRKDLELHIEDLDIKREADKNQRFILAMKESIREPIQDLSSASQSQIQLLTTQNQSLAISTREETFA